MVKKQVHALMLVSLLSSLGCGVSDPDKDDVAVDHTVCRTARSEQGEGKKMTSRLDNQGTPQAVLKKMHQAFLDGDRNAFRECHDIPPGAEAALVEFFDTRVAVYRFLDAVEDAYGLEGVAEFEDPEGARPGMAILLKPPRETRWLDDITLQTEGDRLVWRDPWTGVKYVLGEKSGAWRVVQSDFLVNADKEARRQAHVRKGVESCMNLIGRPGVTVDTLRMELAKRWATSAADPAQLDKGAEPD